ncbi:MAG: nucleoside deaminase [Candidatus Marinimicrobia bacterium]|nr:nucleoside deaminase [Candidatus Neomarinimicrobiota bacterium]MCH8070076.1 nucleoside deaminase [Candidatus Neomarinimicrobiota bacterium]
MKHHERWMRLALKEAKKAFESGEVPVGCVIVRANTVIGKGYNQREQLKDPTAHAEIIAITAAANFLNDWRLEKCTLYVTKEPCAMCAGAILNARVEKIIFGCYDEKEGCCGSLYNICADPRFSHKCAVRGGVLEDACQTIIVSFFKSKR